MRRSRRGRSLRSRRWGAPGCIAVALASALLACLPAGVAAESPPVPPEMCGREFVRDYGAPLQAMPGADPPPQGELPFGPRNFGIHRVNRSQLPLEGSNFGYRFSSKNAGSRVLQLGWRAVATFRRVSPAGGPRRVVAVRSWQVRSVKDLSELELAIPADRAGFFRVDLHLATLGGRTLARYRDYFRVLRRSNDVGVAVSAPAFRPGEAAYGQVANAGAGMIIFPVFLEVERFDGNAWVEVPQPPSPASVADERLLMSSGEAGRCHRFDVPLDASPGLYRFLASVYVTNLQKRQTVTAQFQVQP